MNLSNISFLPLGKYILFLNRITVDVIIELKQVLRFTAGTIKTLGFQATDEKGITRHCFVTIYGMNTGSEWVSLRKQVLKQREHHCGPKRPHFLFYMYE